MNNMDLTQNHLIAGIKWISLMSDTDRWDLTDEQVANLLGEIDVKEYVKLREKAEQDQNLVVSTEMIERLSLLLGIWKNLQLLVPSSRPDLAYTWFKKPNTGSMLKGRSIKDYLLESKDINTFHAVKQYLAPERFAH